MKNRSHPDSSQVTIRSCRRTGILCSVRSYLLWFSVLVSTAAFGYQMTYWSAFRIGRPVLLAVFFISFLAAGLKLVTDCFTLREVIGELLFMGVGTIAAISARDVRFFCFCFMVVAARDTDAERLLRAFCIGQGVLLLVVVLSSQLGAGTDYIFVMPGDRIRHSMGFAWATKAPIMFFFWTMTYALLRRKRLTIAECLVAEAVNYWFYRLTNTRTCFFLATIVLVCFMILKYTAGRRMRKLPELLCRLSALVPVLCCVVSIGLHAVYTSDSPFLTRLNSLLTGRLGHGRNGLSNFGVRLFGRKIEWVANGVRHKSGDYNYVDCSYLKILLMYGLVFLCILVFFYALLCYRAARNGELWLLLVLFAVLAFCMTEPYLLDLGYNPLALLIFCRMQPETGDNTEKAGEVVCGD